MDEELLDRLRDLDADVDACLDRLLDDEEMYLHCVQEFATSQNLPQLREAVEARDVLATRRELHTMIGMALNLGFLPLLDVCRDMQLDIHAGRIDEGFAKFPAVEENVNMWLDAIGK